MTGYQGMNDAIAGSYAMREMRWVPGVEVEEDEDMEQNYGNRMPKAEAPMFVCHECGGLNKHLRSCSQSSDDQCEYCRAPSGYPHHHDCPNE